MLLVAVVAGALAGGCSGGGGDEGGDAVSAGSGDGNGAVADDGTRRELASGTEGPSEAGEIVATSAEQWQEKWQASGATGEAPDVDEVDFSEEVAIGIFAGERTSGGWRIDPEVKVKIQGRFAAIAYTIVGPGEGCQTTQALTSPYLVLAVKGEAVRFEQVERLEPCD